MTDIYSGEPVDNLRPVEPPPGPPMQQRQEGDLPFDRSRIYAFLQYERGRQGIPCSFRAPMEWAPDIQRIVDANPEYENLKSALFRDALYHRMVDHSMGGVKMAPEWKNMMKLAKHETTVRNSERYLKQLEEVLSSLKDAGNKRKINAAIAEQVEDVLEFEEPWRSKILEICRKYKPRKGDKKNEDSDGKKKKKD